MKTRPWTKHEIQILETFYGKLTEAELTSRLPGRTPESIGIKANRIGLTLWANAGITLIDASRIIGCDRLTVARRAEAEGVLKRIRQRTFVQPEWVERCRLEYQHGSRAALCKAGFVTLKHLSRTLGVHHGGLLEAFQGKMQGPIFQAVSGFKLIRAGKWHFVNPHDVEVIRRRLEDLKGSKSELTVKAAALETGLTEQAIRKMLTRVGLRGGRKVRLVQLHTLGRLS
jgi:hypothetical protein